MSCIEARSNIIEHHESRQKPCFIAAARKIAAATALVSPLEWTRRYHPSYARTDRRGERADPDRPCGMRECPRSDLLRVFFTAGLSLLFAGQSRAEQARSKGAPTGKLHSKDRSKQASSAAGPGYTSAHPAFRNSCSVKPPQNMPTVRTAALPAASASYRVSQIAPAPSILSFLRTTLKMSGASFVLLCRLKKL
ncbi:hypothetical protein ACVMB1_000081 [Bradyrhizobium sp. USDA 4504]